MEEFKCKLKDIVHDLLLLGVTDITFDCSGIGMAIADELKYNGVNVDIYAKWKNL